MEYPEVISWLSSAIAPRWAETFSGKLYAFVEPFSSDTDAPNEVHLVRLYPSTAAPIREIIALDPELDVQLPDDYTNAQEMLNAYLSIKPEMSQRWRDAIARWDDDTRYEATEAIQEWMDDSVFDDTAAHIAKLDGALELSELDHTEDIAYAYLYLPIARSLYGVLLVQGDPYPALLDEDPNLLRMFSDLYSTVPVLARAPKEGEDSEWELEQISIDEESLLDIPPFADTWDDLVSQAEPFRG